MKSDGVVRIREHPMLLLVSGGLLADGVPTLISGDGGSLFRLWALAQLLLGIWFGLRWRLAGIDVSADRIQLRSIRYSEVYLRHEYRLEAPASPATEGAHASRWITSRVGALWPNDGSRAPLAPVAVRREVLQLAIDEATRGQPTPPLPRLRLPGEADFRHGRLETWVRRWAEPRLHMS